VPIPPHLFKRLSALGRRRLAEEVTTARDLAEAPDGARTSVPAGRADGEAAPAAPTPAVFEALVPGREVRVGPGRCFVVRRSPEAVVPPPAGPDEAAARALARFCHVVAGPGRTAGPDDLHPDLAPLLETDPRGLVFLDIETGGLGAGPVFLVGLMRWTEGGLAIEQWLARDYAEEAPMLRGLGKALRSAGCLITYNGRSFDLPRLEARRVALGLAGGLPPVPHVDLLPEARRRWRRMLPNCRLQTLEWAVLGRRRLDDIPGPAIPAAYHDFVRARQSGDAALVAPAYRRMLRILHHNALDLVTMAELIVHLLEGG